MLIEAVTVSINFGDYLYETLPLNRKVFDRILVVTSPHDHLTKDVCRRNEVEFVETTRHLEGGGFDKGKAINDGMKQFHFSDWLCHIDADIVVPSAFRNELPQFIAERYQPKMIFGCQRLMSEGVGLWREYQRTGVTKLMRKDNVRTDVHLPVGFFQLWHSDDHQWYPEGHPTAGHSDLEFSRKFKRKCHWNRQVIHLSVDSWVRGRDDTGRTTPKWSA